MTSITIPEGVKRIGYYAFYECSSLESVVIPEGVASVNGYTFAGCSSLTSVSLPSSVYTIGSNAFFECTSLTAITIPENVNEIGDYVFQNCSSLTEIIFKGNAPAFYNNSLAGINATAYYPDENSAWTEDVRRDYGGNINWVAVTAKPVISLSASAKGLTVSWNKISGAEKYNVQRGIIGGSWTALTENTTGLSYTDASALMGETYTYRVCAYKDGSWGSWSDVEEVLFNPFTDVPSTGKTLEYVSWAFNNGIVNGTGETAFSPNNSCTRIQFIMMLWKMNGSQAVKEVENPFSDISGSKTIKAIKWALKAGVINSGKTFDPNGEITRIQIVMMLYKLAGSPKMTGTNPFSDISGNKKIQAVLWAKEKGITKGTGDGTTFSPNDPCTRLQLVIFLYKYNKQYKLV